MKQIDGIKRAESGTLGESRTKAFLMDRFWILERSVDIEGADFLIQRKLHSQSILSDTPPRFGIVQSKFSQDKSTNHKLKKEYVMDSEGTPHMEFFLVVNIGYEDSQTMCLLSAKDIVETFSLDSSDCYSILTRKLIGKFEVTNRKNSLDYMENSIRYVEFFKNRMYIFNELGKFSPDLNAIDPDFTFDIDYSDGKVSDIFREKKQEAYDFILQIEEIHKHLVSFVKETNPIESCYIAQSFNLEYDNLRIPEIFSMDFYYKSRNYSEQIERLRKDGILNSFLSLRSSIRHRINSFLENFKGVIERDSRLVISIKYDTISLDNLIVDSVILSESNPSNGYFEFREVREGNFKAVISIGWHLRNGNLWRSVKEICLIDMVQKIYELKYFENDNEA